jgi:hypothetical protein
MVDARFFDRTIAINIGQVRQIDDLDGFLRGQAEFFSRVTVDGKVFAGDKLNGDDINTNNRWIFLNDTGGVEFPVQEVPIKIEIFESDNGTNPLNNTQVDVNPNSGKKELNLTYNLVSGRVKNADTGEFLSNFSGQTIVSEGAGDRDQGAIEFRVTGRTGPNLPFPVFTTGDRKYGGTFFRGNSLAVGDISSRDSDDLIVGAPEATFSPTKGKAGFIDLPFQGFVLGQRDLPSSMEEAGDHFGASVVTGDFDGDRQTDILVGMPFARESSGKRSGGVHVVYNDGRSLGRRDQVITRQHLNVPEENEAFGNTLAAADFNGDNIDDAVIGIPFDKAGSRFAGAVQVIYGSPTGLNSTRKSTQTFHRDTAGIPGGRFNLDEFGTSVATGDFDGDGNMDLAIGAPGAQDVQSRTGVVDIIFGTDDGLPTNPTGSPF